MSSMTDSEMLDYLVSSADVPKNARMSYAAGYFESTLLTLMTRYPEVRSFIEDRVAYRQAETDWDDYNNPGSYHHY